MFGLKLDRLFGSSLSHKQIQRRRVTQRYTRSLQFDRLEDRRMLSVNLGTAGSFAVLGGQTITNTGPSVISGSVGVSPGSAITGFPPGTVNNGTIHTADAVASQAQIDLTTAYNAVAGEAVTSDLTGQDLGGLTLTPGVYHFSSSAQLTGVLTLDAEGDPNAEFDFQIGSTLTTASDSSVVIINGGIPCDVVWQVGSSATLGTTTAFEGHILALTSITVQTGATVQGSVLAQNGSVTLDDNVINNLNCTNGSISGTVFDDASGGGVEQSGAVGLAGVTVYLDANNSGVFAAGDTTATTDASGNYTFSNLGPGTYHVLEVAQPGVQQTTTNPAAITLGMGTAISGVDIGDFNTVSVSGSVYQDTNDNGVQDTGEAGLAGSTVFLDTNNNGVLDTGETSTTTDASGNYTFSNVGPGTYQVAQVLPTGFTQTTTSPAAIVTSSGANVSGVSFGDFQAVSNSGSASISGTVFKDTSGNGVRTSCEAGLAGATVFLDTNNNGVLDTGETSTTTDSKGNYSFTNLGAGTYHVVEVQPTGFTQTTLSTTAITLTTGQAVSAVNFGEFKMVSISGRVLQDTTSNSGCNKSETGLAGATVFLDTNNNGVLDAGETSTTTNASGNYTFSNVGPGTYHVAEVLPTGFTQTTTSPSAIVTRSGHSVSGVNFGDLEAVSTSTSASISGIVFKDTNGNGVHTSCEAGLAGATVFLDTNNNGVLDTGETSTTTDSKGNYSFTNLGAGTYHVVEVLPTGCLQTTSSPTTITLTTGQAVSAVNFGDFKMVSISGSVLQGTTSNGGCNKGETGMAGATVFLDTNNNGVLDAGETSTTTDSKGNYSFANLGPGTYHVAEVLPTGFTQKTTSPTAVVTSSGHNITDLIFGNLEAVSGSGGSTTNTNRNGGGNTCTASLSHTAARTAVFDRANRSTTTDSNCDYAFANRD